MNDDKIYDKHGNADLGSSAIVLNEAGLNEKQLAFLKALDAHPFASDRDVLKRSGVVSAQHALWLAQPSEYPRFTEEREKLKRKRDLKIQERILSYLKQSPDKTFNDAVQYANVEQYVVEDFRKDAANEPFNRALTVLLRQRTARPAVVAAAKPPAVPAGIAEAGGEKNPLPRFNSFAEMVRPDANGMTPFTPIQSFVTEGGQAYLQALADSGGNFQAAAARTGTDLKKVFVTWGGELVLRNEMDRVAAEAGNTETSPLMSAFLQWNKGNIKPRARERDGTGGR